MVSVCWTFWQVGANPEPVVTVTTAGVQETVTVAVALMASVGDAFLVGGGEGEENMEGPTGINNAHF